MAYNDAPFAKVPTFPDQFQELVQPVCNPTNVGMLAAHTAKMTILNRVIRVKMDINTEIAEFPRTDRRVELTIYLFRVTYSVDTTVCGNGGILL